MKERLLILLAVVILLTPITPVLPALAEGNALPGSSLALHSGLDADCHSSGHCGS